VAKPGHWVWAVTVVETPTVVVVVVVATTEVVVVLSILAAADPHLRTPLLLAKWSTRRDLAQEMGSLYSQC
jgi:hypothetical protein